MTAAAFEGIHLVMLPATLTRARRVVILAAAALAIVDLIALILLVSGAQNRVWVGFRVIRVRDVAGAALVGAVLCGIVMLLGWQRRAIRYAALVTLAAVAALAIPALAQSSAPMRVAVIDVNRVLTTSVPGKAAYGKLKAIQDEKMARAQKMDDEIKALDNDINTKKISLSEEKLTDMQKQLSDKKIAMQRYAQDADREVGEARDRALLELENKIKPVIDQMGKEMGLAVIFNKFESGLIYASDAIDITETMITRFNAAQGGAAAK